MASSQERRPLLGSAQDDAIPAPPAGDGWILFAISSGACAAFNGVFAKLYVGTVPFAFALSRIFSWLERDS